MTAAVKWPYYSRLASSLSPYVPGEQPKDGKFIKLNTNENPYPPSPKVYEAIRNAADGKLRLYPDPSSTAYREAVASRWNISTEQVFAGNGSDEILAFAFAAFFNSRNDEGAEPILFPNISYSFYPVYAALWNILYRTPELDGEFQINPADYMQKCGGVILANPNAPTGRILDVKALGKIAEAQDKNGRVLIVDEAYISFADLPGAGSMIPCFNEHPNILVIHTLSKDASLAGMRTAYAAGSAELINGLCRVRDSFNSYTMDRLVQAASAAAVSDTAYYDEINAKVRRTRDRCAAALGSLGFTVVPSQTNFIFVSPPSPVAAAELFAELRDRGILVRHFNLPLIDNYLRISMGTDDEMDILINACREIIAGH
ncbi:MAG: aminotransferase class I/II-fold pyridoxal phosphate-dependent enzyme [Treponema sp.]|nr:aminotransferase class I/II-fold pyridoxal phosphate-dependent enzyme [Treponema sp.]